VLALLRKILMKPMEFARITDDLLNRREPFAIATVVKTEGSSLGKPGFKEIISKDGEVVYGSLGGVCPDSAIAETAKKTMTTGVPRTVKVFLESVDKAVAGVVTSRSEDEIHVETNCGGEMEIYVEPYLPQQRLILIGQGGKDNVEDALVKLGKMTDFEVVVIDHSPVLSEEPDQLIKDIDFDLSKLKLYDTDSVVMLTRGARDVEILNILSRAGPKYVGLMGSRQRAIDNLNELRTMGVKEDFLNSIRAPIGVDIGALTAGEIALSIMAEIVATKYGKVLPRMSLRPGEKAVAASKGVHA
jgi:xanthine dehydrogenase accessory factor